MISRFTGIMICLAATSGATTLREPFPQGCTMSTLGTILIDGSPAGREPFISAVFSDTSLTAGISAAVTGYYDAMNNYGDRSITTVTGGGWLFLHRFRGKAAMSLFNTLDIYKEYSACLSLAAALPFSLTFGMDVSATQLKLDYHNIDSQISHFYDEELPINHVEMAYALRWQLRRLTMAASVNHVPVAFDTNGAINPPLQLSVIVHTVRHAFGAQGVRVIVTPEYPEPVRIAVGQQLNITPRIALQGAIISNPLFIGLGITVMIGNGAAAFSMVNHPVLGWSRGFGAQYGFNPLKKK
jgi:hypothetical protein